MKNKNKSKIGTILVVLATIVLAGIAIYTAIRLYELRQQPVAPNVPSSQPQAAANVGSCSALAFNVTAPTTPTPTPPPACGTSCTTNSDCPANLTCTGNACRNPLCVEATNCVCGSTPTPTPTPTPSETPSPTPGAPNSCNGTCGSNLNCGSDFVCYNGFCRNPSCTTSANCVCGTSTPAPTSTAQPSLPQSGTDWPTIMGVGLGIFTIIGSLLLAL